MKLEQRFLNDLEDCDPPEDESPETQDDCKGNMLVRELKGAALRRQEEAARTEEDFKKIIKKLDPHAFVAITESKENLNGYFGDK